MVSLLQKVPMAEILFSTPINVNSVSTGPTMLNELVAGQNGWFLTWTQTFAGYSAIFFVPGNF